MQGSTGDADIENRLMDKGWGEEGEGGLSGESSTEAYTLTYVKQPMGICWMTQGTQTGLLEQPRGVGKGGRWQGGSRGWGHMSTYG